MKIVHVIPALTKGGAERVAVDLANQAAAAGHEVTLLVAIGTGQDEVPAPLRSDVELRLINPGGRSVRSSYSRAPAWIWSHRKWLLSRDIVHCHLTFGSVFGSLLQGMRKLVGSRTPVVVETYHAVGVAIPKRKRALHALLLGRRDAVAFMAEDSFWGAFRARHCKRQFVTIPNGVSAGAALTKARSKDYRAKLSALPSASLVVGSIGRLVPERRPDLLLETFANIAAGFANDVHLLLGGEGPERATIQSQARRLGVAAQVHLPGLVRDPAGPLSAIDLYLTINVGPVTGIAAIEAAMAGLPVLAVQLDDEYRVSAGDWIWSSNDPKAVAWRAIELLGDPAALARLASAQRAHALEHHSVERMAQAYQRFYEAALESRQGMK